MRPAALLLLIAARAAADSSVPAGAATEGDWAARCAKRIDDARVSLTRDDPELKDARVKVVDGRTLVQLDSPRYGVDVDAWPHHRSTVEEWGDVSSEFDVEARLEKNGRVGEMSLHREVEKGPRKRFVDKMSAAVADCLGDPLPTGRFYRISGTIVSDGCGGKIRLAAKHIAISPLDRQLVADVVGRVYPSVQRGELVFENSFPQATGCAGSAQLFERWTLSPDGKDALAGELVSRWRMPPRCDRPCVVKFKLRATR